MALIQTRKLTKAYKNGETTLIALNEIDLEIACGEIVAITGPSGSGKTTLMHLLGCLDKPTSGQFFLEGQDISCMTSNQLAYVRNQKIGFVFQNFHLLNDLDALENVVLPQLYGGVSEKIAREKSRWLLERVGLGGRMQHYPNQLSGGQKQRMAIARALAMDPPILLADEPTGNLDSENARLIIDLFFSINQERHTTIILVTHEEGLARRARRCIKMKDGRVDDDLIYEGK